MAASNPTIRLVQAGADLNAGISGIDLNIVQTDIYSWLHRSCHARF
jgi:hypothetical protein